MTVTPTLPPVITNCFSTEILPSFFPEIINRIVDCYSLRCVFCYSVHSFGYPLFNFSLLSLRNELVLWVLNILNSESDECRPITQTKIADVISEVYPCDRKTVCRNIKFLQEMGYPIKKTNRGFYFDKQFSVEDVDFVKRQFFRQTESLMKKKDSWQIRLQMFLKNNIGEKNELEPQTVYGSM